MMPPEVKSDIIKREPIKKGTVEYYLRHKIQKA